MTPMPQMQCAFRVLLAILFLSLHVAAATAEEMDTGDTKVMEYCHIANFRGKFFVAHYKQTILDAAPAERTKLWADLLDVIVCSHSGEHADAVETIEHILATNPRSAIGDANNAFLLRQKGLALSKSHDYAAAVAAYDELIREYEDSANPAVLRQAAFAMNHRAVTLGESGDADGAIQGYGDVIARFQGKTAEAPEELLAATYFMKANKQSDAGYRDQVQQTIIEMTMRYPKYLREDAKNEFIRKIVDLEMITHQVDKPGR